MAEARGDFETRSDIDLKTAGAHAYADGANTDVWCFGWCIGDEPPVTWEPGMDPPVRLFRHLAEGGVFAAWNAAFELAIWNRLMVPRYGWPALPVRQVRCSMAKAYAMSLPGSLENAGAAVGIAQGKDLEGRKLMLQMSRPRSTLNDGTLVWWDDRARRDRLAAYCVQDVITEREVDRRLLDLIGPEQDLWVLDQEINSRGVRVDLATIDKLLRAVEMEKKRLDNRMAKATGGRVTTCNQVAELTSWIIEQGVVVDGLAKADVVALLDSVDLPVLVREALRIRREGAKSSVAKLKAMKLGACADGRVRGTTQFHAASTGRWGGRRIQPQNFPRPVLSHEAIEDVVEMMEKVR